MKLTSKGYTKIDGTDCSGKMVERSSEKRVYRDTIKAIFEGTNIPKEFENQTYSAITGSGVVLSGHLPKDSFEALHKLLE